MAGLLTVWGNVAAEAVRDAIAEAGIPTGYVNYVRGEEPPLMTGGTLLVLGNAYADKLSALGVCPKGRKITSLRTKTHSWEANQVRFSYSPAVKNIDTKFYTDFLTDLLLAVRLATTGSIDPQLGKYTYVDDFTDYCTQLQKMAHGKIVPIVFDTETIGLDYLHLGDDKRPASRFVSLQLTIRAGESHAVYFDSHKAMVDWFDKNLKQLEYLFNSPTLSMGGANLKFDLNWLRHFTDLRSTNFKFDTTLVGSLLDENRSNSLATHTKLYVPTLGGYSDTFDAETDKSRMDLVPKELLLPYAGGDTDACYQVRQKQLEQLKQKPALCNFYVKVWHPAGRAFEEAEFQGVHVDMDRYKELESDLNQVLYGATAKAATAMGGRIFAKHADDSKAGGLNITKASLIKDFLFSPMGLNLKPRMVTEKTGAPSTAKEHIEMFKHIPDAAPFVEAFLEYSSAAKMLSTYVKGFQKHLRSDGRFHPSYYLYMGDSSAGEGGTVTGRLSARNPAFQCLKGDSLVLTSLGEYTIKSLVEAYEQGSEIEVLTHTGKWKPILGVYRNGIKKVYSVKMESGKLVNSTANHPYLTSRGWVKTEDLVIGDTCYELRTSSQGVHEPHLPQLDVDEKSLPVSDVEGLPALRGQGRTGLSKVAVVQELPRGHGGETDGGLLNRPDRHLRELRAEQLPLGDQARASAEPSEQQAHNLLGQDPDRVAVGGGVRDDEGQAPLSFIQGHAHGGSLDEFAPWDKSLFTETKVVSIEYLEECPTFDLTIQDSHSFVANGIIVHNTIPKHSYWGKRIRSCMTAPEGFLVTEKDYSQGELKVVACMANEENMIDAYRRGLDLHVTTAAMVNNLTYEELLGMKKTDYDAYDFIRGKGKAGNFGLLYGMSAAGFQAYAAAVYGVVMSLQEAEEFRSAFLYTAYPALPAYHDVYKAMARDLGYITSPLGRRRHLPLARSRNQEARAGAERQAINSGVQSTLSDMLCWAMAISHAEGNTKHAPCFGAIHDATYNYVPEDNWEKWVKRDLEIMENLPLDQVGWKPQLRFSADAKIGKSMGELEDVHFS